jgi:flagellar motor switch protein FliM
LESRLESSSDELTEVIGERIAVGDSAGQAAGGAAISIQYLGLAPGARLPGGSEAAGTWVIQGSRPRETGRIAIEGSLAVGLIGGLLGGAAMLSEQSGARSLSGLERSLLTRVVEMIAAVLFRDGSNQQWEESRADLSVRAETALANIDPSSGSVLAGFGWQLQECEGLVHVELSCGLIERLTGCGLSAGDGDLDSGVMREDASTCLVVEMPMSGLGVAGVAGLEVGDVILTGRSVESETGEACWDVRVGGSYRYSGQPGTLDGSRAVVLEPMRGVG